MKVHILGNSPSPAVAIYGLRQAAKGAESELRADVGRLVERDFYMDDGLRSIPSAAVAIDLLKKTQAGLACSNPKLHKSALNSKDAFYFEEQASDRRNMDLGKVAVPVQRTLFASSGASLHYLPPILSATGVYIDHRYCRLHFTTSRHYLGFVQTPRRAQRI